MDWKSFEVPFRLNYEINNDEISDLCNDAASSPEVEICKSRHTRLNIFLNKKVGILAKDTKIPLPLNLHHCTIIKVHKHGI